MLSNGERKSLLSGNRVQLTRAQTLILFVVSPGMHLLLYPFSSQPFIAFFCFLFGILWLVFLPGLAVARFFVPARFNSLSLVLLLGVISTSFVTQISFLLVLLFRLYLHPLFLLLAFNSVVLLLMVWKSPSIEPPSIAPIYDLCTKNKWFLLFLIGLALRIVLVITGTSAIAPDASLYSDYARNLLSGRFQTNVLNDGRIYYLWNGVQYCFHQGFVYITALSFLVTLPWPSGPVPLLLTFGAILVLVVYEFTESLFGSGPARIAAALTWTLPIFVFHSVFAYGPELVSTVFLLKALQILLENHGQHVRLGFVAGLMFGFSDLVWSPNFLLFSAAFSLFFLFAKNITMRQFVNLGIIMSLIVVSRVFYLYVDVFAVSLVLTILLLTSMVWRKTARDSHGITMFFLTIMILELIWRGSIQVVYSKSVFLNFASASALLQAPNPPIDIFSTQITFEIIVRFFFFLSVHLTPVLLMALAASLFVGECKKRIVGCLSIIAIGSVGTLFLFAALSSFKETLTLDYLFSDSRFFLSLVSVSMPVVSYTLYGFFERDYSEMMAISFGRRLLYGKNFKIVVVLSTIICLLFPYSQVPLGVSTITPELRYGWVNFPESVVEVATPTDVIICDRATEMAWLTGLRTVYPLFSVGDTLPSSLERLMSLFSQYHANHFVMDSYTLARWKTLGELLYVPLSVGGAIPIGIEMLDESASSMLLPSLVLEVQTSANVNGDYARLYGLSTVNYSRCADINLLSSEWAVSSGYIANQSGKPLITIGEGSNYTNTWRPNGFDLGLAGESGFVLIEIHELSAHVTRIEFYDSDGLCLGNAARLSSTLFFFILGSSTLGDIRIVVEGDASESVLVDSISIWDRQRMST